MGAFSASKFAKAFFRLLFPKNCLSADTDCNVTMCQAPADAHATTATVKPVSTSQENFKGAVICVTGMGLFVATDTLSKVRSSVLETQNPDLIPNPSLP